MGEDSMNEFELTLLALMTTLAGFIVVGLTA